MPETVGQYTGLTDKNGKKIFEGDIIKHYNNLNDNEQYDIGVVFWSVDNFEFLRTSKSSNEQFMLMFDSRVYEVVGNIHDNPELLKDDSK